MKPIYEKISALSLKEAPTIHTRGYSMMQPTRMRIRYLKKFETFFFVSIVIVLKPPRQNNKPNASGSTAESR